MNGFYALLAHELTHVYQFELHGALVYYSHETLLQAGRFFSFGLYDPYRLDPFNPGRQFGSYNYEQQAEIVRFCYLGYGGFCGVPGYPF